MQFTGTAQRVIVSITVLVLVATGGFAAGIAVERTYGRGAGSGPAPGTLGLVTGGLSEEDQRELARVAEMLRLLEEEYYAGPIDRHEAISNALEGMVNGLPDDYTVFHKPGDPISAREALSGEYDGVGIWVDSPSGKLTVISPMKGSPAEAAGLRAGDVILAVDGNSIAGLTQDEGIGRVRGAAGTPVRLTIERPGVDHPFDVVVERATISQPAVAYRLLDSGVAHLSVTLFGEQTTAELDKAITQAQHDGARGIILDLRSNGGGWVNAAQEMIGRFIAASSGPALYEDTDPSDDFAIPHPILSGAVHDYDRPLVVLVDGGTASAAEIVAGALRDYQRATIVGTTTFGKGSIQRVHQFADGSSVRITVAQWLTPGKRTIEGAGIVPDVVVEAPAGTEPGVDPQLRRAEEVLLGSEE